ncbi:hypothetical protein O181_024398 [Austropuccinia psidii MF-1]|uniref:Reverse transcriptase Ty1/copia-type domain-containing protein n=1 Tax=Austropuccinia psidii MF-1 TaxID=1389203 RepID=A0A9Q3CIW6_9BASI|nr:hypothetical protein [Austropuccinia psidii MF-1]
MDDGAITASCSKLLNNLINKLKIKWDEEVNKIVGLNSEKTNDGYKFYQSELIQKLINLRPSNITALSPLPHNCQLKSNKSTQFDKEYLKCIVILLYIARGSRPDIAYAVYYLESFAMCMTTEYWDSLEKLIAYLRKTPEMGILISKDNPENKLTCYVNANWGGKAIDQCIVT